MKKVLITGANGFVGSWLIEFILNNYPEYYIVAGKRMRSDMTNVKHITSNNLIWADCNIEDYKNVEHLFNTYGPFEKCFHLAAQSFVKVSWDSPYETVNSNITGTLNILEIARKINPHCIIQLCGSSEEYGQQEIYPLVENLPLHPLSPYAVSKVAQENFGYQYNKSYGLQTILTRTFNHEGPRRGEMFVTSTFAKQIVEIEKGIREPIIYHGSLDTYRDYTDVRDVVRAYWMATEKCKPGEPYNICSEKLIQISEVLDIFLSHSHVTIEKRVDINRLRISDLKMISGSSQKFREATGWSPEIPIHKTIKDILEHWRERLK